jgi:GNAT superfamily N-acetyltransferase
MSFDVRRIPAASADATALVGAMVGELTDIYGPPDHRYAPTATVEDFSPPGGAFVAVYDAAGRAVAGGGVKRLDDETGEIKRMYVVPEARGHGLSRLVLTAIEDAARDLGYRRVRLDTGAEQPRARALYSSSGYVDIPDYNGNEYATYWAEKSLV